MDKLTFTTYKLSFFYTLIFVTLFFILGTSFFAVKYFSNENTYVQETAISEFVPSQEWEEIDSIFQALEAAQQTETIEKKQYSWDEFMNDMKMFGLFLWVSSIVFFIISLRLIQKTFRPVSESMDDMKHFIDHAGHELKTPLAVIDSSMQLMNAKQEFDPVLLEKSQKEILRTNKLIETLRDLSNINEISKKQHFSIAESIEKIQENYHDEIQQKQLHISITPDSQDFKIFANIHYFEIVFSNILSNAIKYNKVGKTITLWYRNNTLWVIDEWLGIPQEKQSKVFHRFYRMKQHRKQEWFGLGLALVQRICSMYGWKISLNSEVEKGTQVTIDF